MKIPLTELGLNVEKKPNTYKKDFNGELQSEKYGYNERISYEEKLVLDIDEKKLLQLFKDKLIRRIENDEGNWTRFLYSLSAASFKNLILLEIKSFLSIQKGE